MRNVPNALTALRIVLVPALVALQLASFRGHEWAALAVFLFATLTDTVDGVLARMTNSVTALGQLLDPIADKLLITSAFVCLVGAGSVPAWAAAVIIGREIAVTGFRAIAASKGVVIPASWPGKIKMQLETVTIALFILGPDKLGRILPAARILLGLTMLAALYSAAEYFIKYGPGLVRDKSSG